MRASFRLAVWMFLVIVICNSTLFSQRIPPDGLAVIPKNQRSNLIKRVKQFISYAQADDLAGLCRMYEQKTQCVWCANAKYRKHCPELELNPKQETTDFRIKTIKPEWYFYQHPQASNQYRVDVEIETYATANDLNGKKIIKDNGFITVTYARGNWYFSPVAIVRISL